MIVLLAIKCALIAYVYTVILTRPGMLFSGFFSWVSERVACRPGLEWLFKPIILCTHCVTGQLALWGLVFIHVLHLEPVAIGIDMLAYLSFALLIVEILTWIKND